MRGEKEPTYALEDPPQYILREAETLGQWAIVLMTERLRGNLNLQGYSPFVTEIGVYNRKITSQKVLLVPKGVLPPFCLKWYMVGNSQKRRKPPLYRAELFFPNEPSDQLQRYAQILERKSLMLTFDVVQWRDEFLQSKGFFKKNKGGHRIAEVLSIMRELQGPSKGGHVIQRLLLGGVKASVVNELRFIQVQPNPQRRIP